LLRFQRESDGFSEFFDVFSGFSTDFQSFCLSDPLSETELCATTDPKFIWKSPDGIFCVFPGNHPRILFERGAKKPCWIRAVYKKTGAT
jgi:hypothetical protein